MAKHDKVSVAMGSSKNLDHDNQESRPAARRGGVLKEMAKPEVAQSGPSVRVEYPLEGEVLTQPCYTIRIGTIPEANNVQVSIDQGDWRSCRESLGMWWHDWTDYTKGEHILVARSRIGSDLAATSTPRLFSVA